MRRVEVLNSVVVGSEVREAMEQQVPAHDARCHCLRTIVRSRMPQDPVLCTPAPEKKFMELQMEAGSRVRV